MNNRKIENKYSQEIMNKIKQLNHNDSILYELINKIFYIMIIHMFISIFNIYFIYVILIYDKK